MCKETLYPTYRELKFILFSATRIFNKAISENVNNSIVNNNLTMLLICLKCSFHITTLTIHVHSVNHFQFFNLSLPRINKNMYMHSCLKFKLRI